MKLDLDYILGTDDRIFALPKSPFASVSLGITALRGLGAAGYIIGLLLFSFWVPGDSAELVIGSVSIDWTVVLGGGVFLCIIATILQMGILALSNRTPRPVPTLTLITLELSVVLILLGKLSLVTNLSDPIVIISSILTIPVGIIYVGWLWKRLNAFSRRIEERLRHLYLRRFMLPHIVSVLPFFGIAFYFPRVGLGMFCGIFLGNLCVRGYRDLIMPLMLRQGARERDETEISVVQYFISQVRKSLSFTLSTLVVIWIYIAAFFYDSTGVSTTVAKSSGIETVLGYNPVQFLLGLGAIIAFLSIIGIVVFMWKPHSVLLENEHESQNRE